MVLFRPGRRARGGGRWLLVIPADNFLSLLPTLTNWTGKHSTSYGVYTPYLFQPRGCFLTETPAVDTFRSTLAEEKHQ